MIVSSRAFSTNHFCFDSHHHISMLHFRYGISYHGAAQAASGTKEQVTQYREKSKKLFQSIGQFSRSNRDAVTISPISDIANINDIGSKSKPSCKQKFIFSFKIFWYQFYIIMSILIEF